MNPTRPSDLPNCLECGKLLDQPGDLLSARDGFDCLGCVIEMYDGKPAPELCQTELQDWLDARTAMHRRWSQAVLRDAEADPPDEAALRGHYGDELVDHMLSASVPRRMYLGFTEDQARAIVLHAMPKVLAFPVPAFEDL